MTTDRHLEACPECAQRDIAPTGTTRTTPETVVCDGCGGTAHDMGAEYSSWDDAGYAIEAWTDVGGIAVGGRHACHNPGCGIAVLSTHPDLIARRAANSVRRWWVVLDQRWGDYAGFYAHRGRAILIGSSRSLADVMDEVWAW